MSEKKDATVAAAEIRSALKRQYPATKFSVKTHRAGGGYSAVDVRWIDGPTEKDVNTILADYRGWDNGYYNDYAMGQRSVSLELMTAAAEAASRYYGFPVKVHPDVYIESCEAVKPPDCLSTGTWNGIEALADVVHRAAHVANVYNQTPAEAFAAMFPIEQATQPEPEPEPEPAPEQAPELAPTPTTGPTAGDYHNCGYVPQSAMYAAITDCQEQLTALTAYVNRYAIHAIQWKRNDWATVAEFADLANALRVVVQTMTPNG